MSQSAGNPADSTSERPPAKLYRTHYIHSLWAQGIYYLATGLWPLVSIDTYLAVTGPKTDLWLVRTVGALLCVIAVVLLLAAVRQDRWTEIGVLAVGSASVLLAIDVIHVLLGTIDAIYLTDAAVQLVLLSWWTVILTRRAKQLPF